MAGEGWLGDITPPLQGRGWGGHVTAISLTGPPPAPPASGRRVMAALIQIQPSATQLGMPRNHSTAAEAFPMAAGVAASARRRVAACGPELSGPRGPEPRLSNVDPAAGAR